MEDGLPEEVVGACLGAAVGGAGGKRLAAVAASGVLCVEDVQPEDLPVGEGTHEAVQAAFTMAAAAARRARESPGLAADGHSLLARLWPHTHGLRSWVTDVRSRFPR